MSYQRPWILPSATSPRSGAKKSSCLCRFHINEPSLTGVCIHTICFPGVSSVFLQYTTTSQSCRRAWAWVRRGMTLSEDFKTMISCSKVDQVITLERLS